MKLKQWVEWAQKNSALSSEERAVIIDMLQDKLVSNWTIYLSEIEGPFYKKTYTDFIMSDGSSYTLLKSYDDEIFGYHARLSLWVNPKVDEKKLVDGILANWQGDM